MFPPLGRQEAVDVLRAEVVDAALKIEEVLLVRLRGQVSPEIILFNRQRFKVRVLACFLVSNAGGSAQLYVVAVVHSVLVGEDGKCKGLEFIGQFLRLRAISVSCQQMVPWGKELVIAVGCLEVSDPAGQDSLIQLLRCGNGGYTCAWSAENLPGCHHI